MEIKTDIPKAIEKERGKFIRYLDGKNLRFTAGRQIVFEESMRAHGHFAIEELIKQCRKNKRSVSRATVYRCINELLEAGLIRKTAFGEKHENYEHIYDEKPHHHAHCIKCSKHIEFPEMHEDDIYRPFLENKGFHILGHEMHFYGICRDCQEKEDHS